MTAAALPGRTVRATVEREVSAATAAASPAEAGRPGGSVEREVFG